MLKLSDCCLVLTEIRAEVDSSAGGKVGEGMGGRRRKEHRAGVLLRRTGPLSQCASMPCAGEP